MFSDLDPILHSQLRLAIVSLLIAEEKADFARIKQATEITLTHKGLLAFESYVEALKSYLVIN